MTAVAPVAWRDPFGGARFPYQLVHLSRRCAAFLEPSGLSSVGVIEADEGLVVVDSTIHPAYGAAIVERIAATWAKPILYLVNTHFHRDHTFGNASVPVERGIVSHARCADYLARYGAPWRDECSSFYRDGVDIRVPTLTFDGADHVLEALSIEVRLLHVGGHSHDSCLVHVPGDGVVFAGDTVFNRVAPYVGRWSCLDHFGSLTTWIDALAAVAAIDAPIIVPGHGPRADRGDVDDLRRFFEVHAARVHDGVQRGDRLKEVWRAILRDQHFPRRDLPPELYLHMTMALWDELTGAATLHQR